MFFFYFGISVMLFGTQRFQGSSGVGIRCFNRVLISEPPKVLSVFFSVSCVDLLMR